MSAFSDLEKRVSKVILGGMKAGLTEARSLQDAGLLYTPEVKKSVASTALLDVARLLEETPIHQIVAPGVPPTGNDIKRSIALWIEGIVEDNKGK